MKDNARTELSLPVRCLRFSLLNVLLFLTIVAMAIVIWQQHRELAPLQKEIKRLRAENGHLFVDDPTLIHAIKARNSRRNRWKFRVWVPKDTQLFLRSATSGIPQIGLPKGAFYSSSTLVANGRGIRGGLFPLHPGEHVIEVEITSGANASNAYAKVLLDGKINNGVTLREETSDWISSSPRNPRAAISCGVDVDGCSIQPDQAFVLLRCRAMQPPSKADGFPVENTSPCEGLLLWIDDKSL